MVSADIPPKRGFRKCDLSRARAAVRLEDHLGGRIEIARVALVGVDVNFQLGCFVRSHEHVFEGDAAIGTDDLELHHVTIGDTVMIRVGKIHVHVAGCPDDALIQFDRAGRTDEHTTGRAVDLAAVSDRRVNAQGNRIGQRQLDLTCRPGRTKHSNIG